jgi:hypothetical protein
MTMAERDDDHFDLDDDFVAESDDDEQLDRYIERRVRPEKGGAVKKGKAAWSKLEDVLAERRLQKQLKDFDDE